MSKDIYSENKKHCKICDSFVAVHNYEKHLEKVKYCLFCNKKFCTGGRTTKEGVYKGTKSNKIFCSKSCSVSYTNKKRKPQSKETRIKKRNKMIDYHKRNTKISFTNKHSLSPRNKINIVGSYTYVYCKKCKHCGDIFYTREKVRYCPIHANLYRKNYKEKYKFTFNIYKYPNLFDLSLIEKYGWYNNKTNKNGITRDHRISINEAIKNDYDPYYIKHPLNCELMFMYENNKKNINSSMSYLELIRQIEEYEKIKL